jgi:ribosomal-protein-alanine N-acetyltransferase
VALVFRPMTEADLESVIRNERQSYSHPWSERIFKDCIEGQSECWVIALGNEVTGHLVISSVLDEGHILNICIGREWQGQGQAHKLLTFATERLCDCGVNTIFLEVRVSNARALGLYESHGFICTGRRKNYYPAGSVREDAIVMSKILEVNTYA